MNRSHVFPPTSFQVNGAAGEVKMNFMEKTSEAAAALFGRVTETLDDVIAEGQVVAIIEA